jgi:uncharacterized coiled-coil protein SlyX
VALRIFWQLDKILTRFDRRITRLEAQMATQAEFLNQVRDATDRLAERVRVLAGGDPRWQAIVDDLNAMGQDESNPIPDPTPDPGPSPSAR